MIESDVEEFNFREEKPGSLQRIKIRINAAG